MLFKTVLVLLLLLTLQPADARELKDSDKDGYADEVELANGYSPWHANGLRLREVDSDKDGLWDDWEMQLGTDRYNIDTDGDGHEDGVEVAQGYDPNNIDPVRVGKRIEIDLAKQVLTYFFGEVRLDEMAISGGLVHTPTPVGEFKVIKRKPTVQYGWQGGEFYYPKTKWNLMFKAGSWGNYYIHGAWWHNNFGKPMSHGCVNVQHTYDMVGRLYDWADEGTPIFIYSEKL